MSKTFLNILVCCLCFSCAAFSPSEKISQEFMEAYYQQADLKKAGELASGLALEKIQASVQLREGQVIDASTHRPGISYKKIEAQVGDEEATYIFLVTISSSDFRPIKKQSRLRLRMKDQVWKVTQFSDQDL